MKNSKKPGMAPRKIAAPAVRPNVQKILTTTDFSDDSRAGVRYAAALAERLNADVALLHVVEPRSWMDRLEARKDSELVALAQAQLAKVAKREVGGDATVTSSVRTGKPFHEITTAAREGTADLIVIATHGYTGVERILLGSTAERVVRHAPCPVLVVPTRELPKRAGKAPPFQLKKILVPIDFSNLSKDALPYAVFLAGRFDAEVILLHVVEPFAPPAELGYAPSTAKEAEAASQQCAAEQLARVRQQTLTPNMSVQTLVRSGAPFHEICCAAKALGADLIVLTTHGYTGLKHVWLGSTAERVVRHAPCPVLVVRPTAP